MNRIFRNDDYPLCICFNKDGYVYCADQRHMSGMFFCSELKQLKNAVEKTLLLYERENITDENIEFQDEEERERIFENFNNIGNSCKIPRGDDLYLIHDTVSNLLKIGRSVDVKKRLKQLQTANGHKLELLCVLKKQGDLEKKMQEKFVELNTNGEWYKYSDKIINEYIHLGGIILNKDSSTTLFEECWVAYNRKGSKKKSKDYWNKLSDDDKLSVLQHIRVYVSSRERQYQKDFERYLRDKTFKDIVSNGNEIIYDPTLFATNEYLPQGRGIWFNDDTKSYWSMDSFYDETIYDGYTDDNRPDGAQITLNNARGTYKWNTNNKKWIKQ